MIIALAAVPIGLVLLQPDLGTVMVLGVIIMAMLAVAGVSGRQLLVLGAARESPASTRSSASGS